MIYITGDTHRGFKRIENFCKKFKTTKTDLLIILGDAGINFYGKYDDDILKRYLETLPIKLLCVRGNHEERPENIKTYKKASIKTNHFEGVCFYEQDFPSLYFLDNGVFYLKPNEETRYKCLNINGAYSVDKYYRLMNGGMWFKDEQLSEEEKKQLILTLPNEVDYVFSHTCPEKYIPTEMFISGLNQSTVDHSMETFLDEVEDKLEYKKWFCGHWHTDKTYKNMIFMFNSFKALEVT